MYQGRMRMGGAGLGRLSQGLDRQTSDSSPAVAGQIYLPFDLEPGLKIPRASRAEDIFT